jgi:hypothetical protein
MAPLFFASLEQKREMREYKRESEEDRDRVIVCSSN